MGRKLLGILGGLAAGALIIVGLEAIDGLLHPLPLSVDAGDPEKLRTYVARLPSAAFVLVLCGHALASIAAGAVATLVARRTAMWPAVATGVLLFFAGAVNAISFPHPTWFIGLDLGSYVPLAWLGSRLVLAPQAASGAGSAGA